MVVAIEGTRIRFVGGPWHNLVPLVGRLLPVLTTSDGMHRYFLSQFETEYSTKYYQYVHESCVSGQDARDESKGLARWVADLSLLEAIKKKSFRQN